MRPPRPEDAPTMFRTWATDPAVTRYLAWQPHADVSETYRFIDGAVEAWRGDSRAVWLITRSVDLQPIGLIELRIDGATGSFGYVLAKSAWGKGYMTEAVKRLVVIALKDMRLTRVWAVCDCDNVPSARVLEKAGLRREGRLEKHSRHPNVADEPRDVFLYGLGS